MHILKTREILPGLFHDRNYELCIMNYELMFA